MTPSFDAAVGPRAQQLAAAAALFASMLAILDVQSGLFRAFWFNDIAYFWSAGALWRDGVSPYLPAYIDRANALVATQHIYSAFYYAPAIRPLAELFAAAPLDVAAKVFFAVNIAAIVLSCRLLAMTAARFAPAFRVDRLFVLFLFVACVVLRHPLVVAAIGQITILLLLAFSLFLYAVASQRATLAAPAIVVLLLKPHFGLAVCAFALLHRPLRGPLVGALAVYGALTIYGLSTAPAASLHGFLANIAAYADHPRHAPAHASGFGQIFSSFGVSVPIFALAPLLAAGAAVALRAADPRERVLAAAFLPVWTLFAGPNHMEDFTILLPLALVPLLATPRRVFVTGAGLLLVGRGHELVLLTGVAPAAMIDIRTLIHTCGLALLLVAAFFAAWRPKSVALRAAVD